MSQHSQGPEVVSSASDSSEEFAPAPPTASATGVELHQSASSMPEPGAAPARPDTRWSLALGLGAAGLAVIGQIFFALVQQDVRDGLVFSAAAALLFLAALEQSNAGAERWRRWAGQAGKWLKENVAAHSFRLFLLTTSLVLTYVNWQLLQTRPVEASHTDTLLIWLTALLGYALAFAPLPLRIPPLARRDWVSLIGLVTLALALRLVLLDSLPADWHMDELSHAYVAVRVLQGQLADMFMTWQSDGTLPGFVMAIPLRVLGLGHFSVRLLPALAGTLTVALVFLFGRRMFDFPAALLAALLLATSHFHLHFSRSGLGYNIYDGVLAVAVLGLLYHGLEARSRFALALSGLGLGLTLYGFAAGRVIGLIVAAYFAVLWLKDPATWRAYVVPGLIVATGALIAAAPMLLWARQHPGEFWTSAHAESILFNWDWLTEQAQLLGTSEWAVLVEMLKQALLVFNYYPASMYYGASLPALDFVGSALGVLGLAVILRFWSEPRFLLLCVWFAVPVVAGGALVAVPAGSAYRVMMVFPALCLLIGLGLSRLLTLLEAARWRRYALVAGLVFVSAGINLKAYFVDFGPQSFTTLAQDTNALAGIRAHAYAGQLGAGYRVYFLGLPRLSAETYYPLGILNRGVGMVDRVEPLDGDFSFVDETKGKAFLALPERVGELGILELRYPGGRLESNRVGDTLLFTVYRVP